MKTLAIAHLASIDERFDVRADRGSPFNWSFRRWTRFCRRLSEAPQTVLRSLMLGGAAEHGKVTMMRLASLSRDRSGREAAADENAESGGFDQTILCHLDAAYNLARYLTRDENSAEDLVQEAILKAYKGFSVYRGGDAKAWLLTIVRREVIDWANARRRSHQVFSDVEEDQVEDIAFDEDDPEQALIKKDEKTAVRQAIYSLPATYRESIILRDIEELSYKDIALITEVSIGTVMSRLSRGRELLMQRLQIKPMRPRSGQ